jgi:hypothetical protein
VANDNSRKTPETKRRGRPSWLNKENVLMTAGLALIAAVFITAEQGKPFHYEFLILAAGMCGLGIAQWGDRRNGK